MSYDKPEIATVRIDDLLAQMGPARAIIYQGGDDENNDVKDDEGWG
jgi:hypothetical protein